MQKSRFFGFSRRAAALGVVMVLAACQPDNGKQDQTEKKATPVTKTTPTPKGPLSPPEGAGNIAGVEAILAATMTNEAVKAAGPGGNVVLSPASILQGLGLVAAGAAGETHDEMETALGWRGDDLAPKIAAHGKSYGTAGLRIANALWLDEQVLVKDSFKQAVARDFGATIDAVDFQTDAEDAAEGINIWVSKQTNDRIPAIVAADQFDEDTRGVLVNALWFQGRWTSNFYDTQQGDFTTDGGKKQPADLMHLGEYLPYSEDAEWQMVRLHYTEGDFAMDVFLPPADKPEAAIDAVQMASWNTTLGKNFVKSPFRESEIVLTLPRFEVRTDYSLTEMLIAMGMPKMFSNLADFSRMIDQSTPESERIKITDVQHGTFLRVDEYGTEAAAYTDTGWAAADASAMVPPKIKMTVDRPFYFAIRDLENNGTLFFGRIANPIRTTPGVDPFDMPGE